MKYDNDKHRRLARQTLFRQALHRMERGVGTIHKDPWKPFILFVLLTGLLGLWLFRYKIMGYPSDGLLAPLCDLAMGVSLVLLAVAVSTALFGAWGGPWQAGRIQDNLYRAGIVNAVDEAPTLLSITSSPQNQNVQLYTFTLCGLSISAWLDWADKIQTALNKTIVDIRYGIDHQHFLVSAVPPMTVWPTNLLWSDHNLPLDQYTLVLGVGPMGEVTWNLANIPHALLGGSTNSGKTALLKVLLRQAVMWGAEVYIADFKGGVDFGPWWRDNCGITLEMDGLLEMLDKFMRTLEERRALFRREETPNLEKYNETHSTHLRRMIFACDEVAAMMDKTNQTKERKAQIDAVIERLSIIAQQGRAFGIHLILSTQRPDANLIPGQIRSNIDFKVCGRADSILSGIIIDSPAASELIPKDAKGRFILNDGGRDASSATLFQAYYLPDRFA